MSTDNNPFAAPDARKFQVRCDADTSGRFCVGTDSLIVHVGQRIFQDGAEDMWDSVSIYTKEHEDGSLVLQVLISNPDWDEPLQIASIRSRPGDRNSLTPLRCNLNHTPA